MVAFHHFINRIPERDGRTYACWVQQDLFGDWTVVRVNGGRHRQPVLYSQVVASRDEGEKLVAELRKVRLRHGYEDISTQD